MAVGLLGLIAESTADLDTRDNRLIWRLAGRIRGRIPSSGFIVASFVSE